MALESLVGFNRNNWSNYCEDVRSMDNEINEDVDYLVNGFQANRLPVLMNPRNMVMKTGAKLIDGSSGKAISIDFDKGTTTLAFRYKDGICVCADSRATGGQYIGSQSVKKIIEINEYLLGTMAGGAADCQYWERILAERCRVFELRNRERISVAAASKLLANILYNYKGMGLSMGVMIAGWDKKGPGLYYVDSEGNRLRGDVFSVGSGSTFAYGVLDTGFNKDMKEEEVFDLGRRAIYHATHRDAYSGGTVRVYAVHKDGWKIVTEEDATELHYKFQEEKMV